MILATCEECGAEFTPRRADQRFCCDAHRQRWRRHNPNTDSGEPLGDAAERILAAIEDLGDRIITAVESVHTAVTTAVGGGHYGGHTAVTPPDYGVHTAVTTAVDSGHGAVADGSRLAGARPLDNPSTVDNPASTDSATGRAHEDVTAVIRRSDTAVTDRVATAVTDDLTDDDRHEATLRSIAMFYREAGHPITRDQAAEVWGALMALAPRRNGEHVADDERWCLYALRSKVSDPVELLTPARRRGGTPQPPPVGDVLRAANGPGWTRQSAEQARALTERSAPAAKFQVADAIQQAKIRAAAAMGAPAPDSDRAPTAGLHGEDLARAQLAEHARDHPAERLVITTAQDHDAEQPDPEPDAWPDDNPPAQTDDDDNDDDDDIIPF
jgi:hypothetical protein